MCDCHDMNLCVICGGFISVEGDLRLADVMLATEPGGQSGTSHTVPAHPWCKRKLLGAYERSTPFIGGILP